MAAGCLGNTKNSTTVWFFDLQTPQDGAFSFMGHRYWESVPKGTWTVINYIDTLNALNDEESRFRYYPEDERIVIFGPEGKAIIVELGIILDSLNYLEEPKFVHALKKYGICL
jgi:hypothetical protein